MWNDVNTFEMALVRNWSNITLVCATQAVEKVGNNLLKRFLVAESPRVFHWHPLRESSIMFANRACWLLKMCQFRYKLQTKEMRVPSFLSGIGDFATVRSNISDILDFDKREIDNPDKYNPTRLL